MGKNVWTLIIGNGRTVGNTRGAHLLLTSYCVPNTLPQVVNKLRLSFSSTKELNDVIDRALPGCPTFETHRVVSGETLELHFQNILACIQCIYGDPEFAQDLAITPECHYTDQEQMDHIFSEMYTGDWWWAVQVRKSILLLE